MQEVSYFSIEMIGVMLVGITVLLAMIGFAIIHNRHKKRFDIKKISIADIDRMSGHEFEDYLYVLLVGLGYEDTCLTKKSRDFGADLLFRNQLDQETVVQAKRISEKLSLDAVQEVFAAKAYYHAQQAMIITSAEHISEPCKKLASATQTPIIRRKQLVEIITLFKKGKKQEAQSILEMPYEEITYNSDLSIDERELHRGIVRAGHYFYKG